MAQTSQLAVKADIKSSPEKFYNFLIHNASQLPTILPHIVQKAEVVQGQEGQPGSVMHIKYLVGDKPGSAKFQTQKVDGVNKIIIFVAVEGEILGFYVTFAVEIVIGKNQVQWNFNYEKANDSVPDPDMYANLAVAATKALDVYLLVN
ncbi:MLP-like protein 34 [Andrographis paniculata]|uniref:MLP-like protein 34 n=1 Tax=Andrographis paniculata TaxID=175694 RepID=UPI0021E968B4|nr:MLP-like protein 34 [Andrographis paniculata]